jgi:hypothetical protein
MPSPTRDAVTHCHCIARHHRTTAGSSAFRSQSAIASDSTPTPVGSSAGRFCHHPRARLPCARRRAQVTAGQADGCEASLHRSRRVPAPNTGLSSFGSAAAGFLRPLRLELSDARRVDDHEPVARTARLRSASWPGRQDPRRSSAPARPGRLKHPGTSGARILARTETTRSPAPQFPRPVAPTPKATTFASPGGRIGRRRRIATPVPE